MAAVILDNSTYNDAALYAKLHNISIADALKVGMKFLMENFKLQAREASNEKYYISPKVKALETGFKCPKDLSLDYKKELSDAQLDVCSVDNTDVYHSYDAKWKDFEDGVQYFSAKRSGADYLVTRNTKDFEENDLKVVDVDKACELLKSN